MTLPHCTGCTEPGEPTHQQETVEHIHDACNSEIRAQEDWIVAHAYALDEANVTIAALREALEKVRGLSISPTFDVATDALAGQR